MVHDDEDKEKRKCMAKIAANILQDPPPKKKNFVNHVFQGTHDLLREAKFPMAPLSFAPWLYVAAADTITTTTTGQTGINSADADSFRTDWLHSGHPVHAELLVCWKML